MSVSLKVAAGAGALGVLLFVALMVVGPVFAVGAIVSLIFGLGFWTATLYVFLARLGLMLLGI